MKSYTYSQARGNFATVLAEAERDGAVEIRRRDGAVFRILPARRSKASPLDVKGLKLGVSTADLVEIVREGRERSQVGMRRFRGKVKWEGNLEESREGRNSE